MSNLDICVFKQIELFSGKLGGGLADDEDLVCAEEETRQYIDPWSKKKIEVTNIYTLIIDT